MRVFLSNLGCKLNQAELEDLARRFVAAGHELAPSLDRADLHVVNTCTVTHAAARDSRKLARRGRRVDPRVRTVLTGCYVDTAAAEAAALAGVDLLVANGEKDRLIDRVHEAFPESMPAAPTATEPAPHLPIPYVPLEFGNSRALVKVEDGCDMSCAFCIIPRARGGQRSRPLPAVVEEVRRLVAGGFQEIVVTGVQISSYRWLDHGLVDLVRALLEGTEVPRLRLTSIAPWQLDDRLLELFAGGRLCRHLHLSLQSGSTATLKRMRRPYDAPAFAAAVAQARRALTDVAVTTDVIVGFPGETDAEFEESLEFAREMAFARLHAFPFSPRPGTAAAEMPNPVAPPVKRQRMERMLALADAARREFWRAQLGKTSQVLWESSVADLWRGTTDNYIPVAARSVENLGRRLTPVRLERLDERAVACRLSTGGAKEGLSARQIFGAPRRTNDRISADA